MCIRDRCGVNLVSQAVVKPITLIKANRVSIAVTLRAIIQYCYFTMTQKVC